MRRRRKRYSARRRSEIPTRRMKLRKAGVVATRRTAQTHTRRGRATRRVRARSTWTQATTWTVMCSRSAEAITSSAQQKLKTVVAAVVTTVAGAAIRARVKHTVRNRAALRVCLRRAPSKPHKASSLGSSGPSSGCKSTHTITTLV